MDRNGRLVIAALSALALGAAGAVAGPHEHGHPGARPVRARGVLARPESPADDDATGRIDVKHFPENHGRPERSWFRLKLRHLDASTDYTLWADDPSTPETDLVQFDLFTTNGAGAENYTQDTKHEGTLPFGTTLDALSGMAVEVRDGAGTTTVLAGTIPSTTP